MLKSKKQWSWSKFTLKIIILVKMITNTPASFLLFLNFSLPDPGGIHADLDPQP